MGRPLDLHDLEHLRRCNIREALSPRIIGIYAGEVVVVSVADENACVRIADEIGERRGIGAAPEGGEPMADTEWVGDDDMRNPRVGQRRVEGGYQGAIRVALNF